MQAKPKINKWGAVSKKIEGCWYIYLIVTFINQARSRGGGGGGGGV